MRWREKEEMEGRKETRSTRLVASVDRLITSFVLGLERKGDERVGLLLNVDELEGDGREDLPGESEATKAGRESKSGRREGKGRDG